MDQRTERNRRRRSLAPREVEGLPPGKPFALDPASADEASADAARRRLRAHGIVPIEPDDRIRVILAPGELVAAIRRSVSLERRKERTEPDNRMVGDLYITTRRLVYLGRERLEYPLAEIQDAIEADGALRLIVGERRGIEIEVSDPRLLRVEIAAVREAARSAVTDAAAVRGEGETGTSLVQGRPS